MAAKWSDKAQVERKVAALKALLERRSKAIHLLQSNGWTIKTFLGESTIDVPNSTDAWSVYWLAKMPGAAPVKIFTIESLERKTIGMEDKWRSASLS